MLRAFIKIGKPRYFPKVRSDLIPSELEIPNLRYVTKFLELKLFFNFDS